MPANIFSTLISKPVNASRATLGGGSGFRFEPAFPQHPLKRGIERAFFHLKQVVGNLLDVLHERVAMHRFQPQGLENHDFQRAREKIAMVGIVCHGNGFYTINTYFKNRYL
jgi:hypothetical protein